MEYGTGSAGAVKDETDPKAKAKVCPKSDRGRVDPRPSRSVGNNWFYIVPAPRQQSHTFLLLVHSPLPSTSTGRTIVIVDR
jgi:hypothetical protein